MIILGEKCTKYFCYVCGQSRESLGGSFGTHNEWYVDTPEDANRCPMYLRYRWGDVPSGRRMEGDSRKSLKAYHKWRKEKDENSEQVQETHTELMLTINAIAGALRHTG